MAMVGHGCTSQQPWQIPYRRAPFAIHHHAPFAIHHHAPFAIHHPPRLHHQPSRPADSTILLHPCMCPPSIALALAGNRLHLHLHAPLHAPVHAPLHATLHPMYYPPKPCASQETIDYISTPSRRAALRELWIDRLHGAPLPHPAPPSAQCFTSTNTCAIW